MKRKRHSPEQIIARLREADAMVATGANSVASPNRFKAAMWL